MPFRPRLQTGSRAVAFAALAALAAPAGAAAHVAQPGQLHAGGAWGHGRPSGGESCLPDDPSRPTCIGGTLADGTPYAFAVPKDWNGTVVVGLDYTTEKSDSALTARLLADGVARGGTSRAITGWDIAQAIDNQAEALAQFERAYGPARQAIASDRSMGGFVAAGVAQVHPDVFDAAVPFCAGLGGSVAQWNQKLDTAFVLEKLVAPGLPVLDVPDPAAAQTQWVQALKQAQQTRAGKARIALAAAIGQLPAWGVGADGVEPTRPDPRDGDAVQEGLFLALAGGPLPYIGQAMSSRPQIEVVSGGNPSWNVGVDYRRQLRAADAGTRRAVTEAYRSAGLDLRDDLRTLARAPRISADPEAVDRFARGIVLDGDLRVPVLQVSNVADQIATVAQDGYYADLVRRAGEGRRLRQTWVESAGHCAYSTAEQVAAIRVMRDRLETGRWPSTTPKAMNRRAERVRLLEPERASRFISYSPPRFNRPLD